MPTYTHFTNIYDIPYSVVAVLFIISKIFIMVYACICWCCTCCKHCNLWDSAIPKGYRRLTCWMLRILFANSEGFTDLRGSSHNNDQDRANEHNNTAYINKVPIQNRDLPVFSILLLCYSLLILLIMYSVYLLDITFTCTEDPGIYCFPQLLNEDDPENPNITNEMRENKITDCSEWTDSNVSDKVGFNCYMYTLNAQEALAVGGGLLAIFTLVTRMVVSMMIFAQKKCGDCCKILRKIVYFIFAVIINIFVFPFIILLTFANYWFDLNRTFDSDDVVLQVSDYVRDNGVQAIIILSTIELLLVIDWRQYVQQTKNNDIPLQSHP